MTHFLISFINAKADKNQEHIDYAFAIDVTQMIKPCIVLQVTQVKV